MELKMIGIILMLELVVVSWAYQQCNIICDDHVPTPTVGNPIRGKAGPKGQKGASAEACECPPLANLRAEMTRMMTELTNKVSELEEKVKFNGTVILVPGANEMASRCGLLQDVDTITDDAFTASSVYSTDFQAHYGRLNEKRYNGWSVLRDDRNVNQWIQVDLGQDTKITGIVTQGCRSSKDRTTSYILLYRTAESDDFLPVVEESGNSVVFAANTVQGSIVGYQLPYPISARWWRINPRTWNYWPTLRFDLYTC